MPHSKHAVFVGVDPGRSSGWALITPSGDLIASWLVKPRAGGSVYAAAVAALSVQIDKHGLRLCAGAVESQWFAPPKAGQNPRTIITLAHTAGECAGALCACGLDAAPWYVTPGEWRALCGLPTRGKELKVKAVERARMLGYDGESDDVAEAVLIAEALRIRCSCD